MKRTKTKHQITIAFEEVLPPAEIRMSGAMLTKLTTELTDLGFNKADQPMLWNLWDLLDDIAHE